MSRAVCRRGLERGARSRPFLAEHLVQALTGDGEECVYVELDAEGYVSAAGGAARAVVRARLAPHAPACGVELALCGAEHALSGAELTLSGAAQALCGGGAALQLRVVRGAAPHGELLLWFAQDALAALDMPFLTLRNITAEREYVCHECGAGFAEPNPLKLHLFLRCQPYSAPRFWRRAAERLRAAAAAAPHPARLEALAAEWGRSRAGAGHACVYCGKLYSRRYGLKIHIRTHTGYRPLRCRHCARAFGDPSNLNKHVRLHAARDSAAAPPPYPCALCGRALARRRDLERHLRTHAPAPAP